MSDAIGGVFEGLGKQVSNAIWDAMLRWLYDTIDGAAADFFAMMGNMGMENEQQMGEMRL